MSIQNFQIFLFLISDIVSSEFFSRHQNIIFSIFVNEQKYISKENAVRIADKINTTNSAIKILLD